MPVPKSKTMHGEPFQSTDIHEEGLEATIIRICNQTYQKQNFVTCPFSPFVVSSHAHLGFIHPVKLGKFQHTMAFLVLKKPCGSCPVSLRRMFIPCMVREELLEDVMEEIARANRLGGSPFPGYLEPPISTHTSAKMARYVVAHNCVLLAPLS
jgi:hypothetical protein